MLYSQGTGSVQTSIVAHLEFLALSPKHTLVWENGNGEILAIQSTPTDWLSAFPLNPSSRFEIFAEFNALKN